MSAWPSNYPYSDTTEYTDCGSTFSSSSSHSKATQYTRYTHYTDPQPDHYNMLANPPAGTFDLPCEFVGIGSCDVTFRYEDTEAWIEHIINQHLRNKLPNKALCWYCDDFWFDAKEQTQGDRRMNFQNRMYHIREHIANGKTANDIRPDFPMLEHLLRHNLISEGRYNEYRRYNEVPCPRSQMSHIYPPGYVPPERQQERERASRVIIDSEKEERRRRRHKNGRK
ncbi:hypothetical protein F4819DRAFT_63101 [Hypoxylon fuscum]|nr:hypothetical protein F4819DRAFT_63101 [Hypoxylon fuscum]